MNGLFFVKVYLIIIAILKVYLIDEYNAYGNICIMYRGNTIVCV